MRKVRTVQTSIFDVFAAHEIGRELKAMSQWLDEHRRLAWLGGDRPWSARGQGDRAGRPAGRGGAALRLAQATPSVELRRARRSIWRTRRRFERLPGCRSPGPRRSRCCKRRSARSGAETWEEVNRAVVREARHEKLEDGAATRAVAASRAALFVSSSTRHCSCSAARAFAVPFPFLCSPREM